MLEDQKAVAHHTVEVRQRDKERKALCILAFMMGKNLEGADFRTDFNSKFVWAYGVVNFCGALRKARSEFYPAKPSRLPGIKSSRQDRYPHLEGQALVVKEKMSAECHCAGNLISAVQEQTPRIKKMVGYSAKFRRKGGLCQIFLTVFVLASVDTQTLNG